MQSSKNCSSYTNNATLFVEADVYIPGREDKCSLKLPTTYSCQTSAFERPDEATQAQLRAQGEERLRERKECADAASTAKLDFRTTQITSQFQELSAETMVDSGLASNCYVAGNDPNHATHSVYAECFNQYDMTDAKGNTVRDTNKKFVSNLLACDVSEKAMPQLMEDARKVCAHNAAQNGYTAKRDKDLACTFSIMPVL